MAEKPALEPARIFHTDCHLSKHALKHPGRREIKCRTDLAQIFLNRFRAFGTGQAKSRDHALNEIEVMITDPCERQIGQRFIILV
ncbi:hypothetical protein MnTg02_01183 [bacterium MnTg02]|nr:hypothetical protein MnTg02_01183 [bacterium MnTg02]